MTDLAAGVRLHRCPPCVTSDPLTAATTCLRLSSPRTELTLGKVLGRGGFCVVNEITKITLQKKSNGHNKDAAKPKINDEIRIHDIVQDRAFMYSHCIRQGKDCRYAIKAIQDSVRSDTHTYVNALVDLALEARFLSVIRHPNIIKMRALHDLPDFVDPEAFVVLDRLYDILSKRVPIWKKKLGHKMGKLMDRGGKKTLAFWLERLTFAYDLSCALKYLHDLGVLYRDLKVRYLLAFGSLSLFC
jgi:serine/threonine protein kinase